MKNITLRAAQPGDEPFLRELYESTRHDEVTAWGWSKDEQDAFLAQQYAARQHHCKMLGAALVTRIVLDGATPIGALATLHSGYSVEINDIALLPAYRGRGIGTALLEAELAAAAQVDKGVYLYVLRMNPAVRLYERLGFRAVEDDGVYLTMCR